jgi:heme/copper-type cytochrome/quinol oxidase subunit 4
MHLTFCYACWLTLLNRHLFFPLTWRSTDTDLSYLMNVGFCPVRMESLFLGLCHNKPKKSVATAIVLEGIIIFVVLYGSIYIFYDN